jgi:uncharacterized protein YbjT (DUF2867 family)
MKILVTGANGFVGSALIPGLINQGHQVFALVRSRSKLTEPLPEVEYIEGDLLRPQDLPALPQVDKVFYLVHGLKEETKHFEYRESVAAVNFLRWLRPQSPTIIYLGGLGEDEKGLSPHLRSRHLTGSILGSGASACIEFRASIILGNGSLSFEMVKALSERFPFRPDFSLLNQPCQPMALTDLLSYLTAAMQLEVQGHEIFEIGGPDVVTYGELLETYADVAGLKRKRIKIPEVEQRVLLKALDYAIPEHANAGKKLTESLEHATVVRDQKARQSFPNIKPLALRAAMDLAHASSTSHYPPIWEKDFLKTLLSDKILTQSGLLSPELVRNLERVGKIKDLLTKK